ncbi:MAG: response regulator [Proteobacteria bacterium]|nr:response regulator [Pseudomonadota bacterium]MBU1739059.1 response regulator [Pseudomonadota bacterium]
MPSIRILIVDDFDTMQKIIRNILLEQGYTNLTFATDGEKAVKILADEKIDLIISDWNMPRMTGVELLKHVRKAPALAHIPFIMVTAEGEKENILKAIQAKVDQYIIKPFTPEMLAQKIRNVLEKAEKIAREK